MKTNNIKSQMKNKKAEIAWETVVKITIALIFLFIITMLIFASKGKISSLFDSFKSFLRFG